MIDVEYDRIILCAGFRFDTKPFDQGCRPALTMGQRLPEQSPEWESTNVPGLYFAGTLVQARGYK